MDDESSQGPEVTSPAPFDGIRVLEFTTSLAGAIAAMYVADFGADVVKVVPRGGEQLDHDPATLYANRNKRVTSLDATRPDGLRALCRLARQADVMVVDRPASFLTRYGLDASTLRAANGQLVYVWMPAHGHLDRGNSLPADDLLLAARTGVSDQQPATEDRPVAPVVAHLTYEHGALAAVAVGAGLLGRQRSGLASAVTVSGLHAVAVMNATIMTHLPGSVRPFGGAKPGYTGGPSFRMYRCRDGRWLFMSALTPSFLEKALSVMGLRSLMDLPGVHGDVRQLRNPDLHSLVTSPIEARMEQKDRAEWLAIFDRAGVPTAPIERRDEWVRSETVSANGGLVTVDHCDLGPVVLPGVAPELTVTPGRIHGLADRRAVVSVADVWTDGPQPERPPGRSETLPLDGIRVFDLGSFMAGPLVSDILGDFGASVVKVEQPQGDGYRTGPPSYAAMNKGKRNLCMDLKDPDALQTLYQLLRDADVLIDNGRPRTPERLGTHYEALRQVNPDIVRCTISGWGEGPLKDSPCFDPLVQARSGLMVAQGGEDDPVLNAMAVHDVGVGTLAAFGAIAALFARHQVGRGQEVRTSLTQASLMQQAVEMTTFAGAPAPSIGGQDYLGPSPGRRLYRCRDGWIAISAATSATTGASDMSVLWSALAAVTTGGEAADTTEPSLHGYLETTTIDEALDTLRAASIPAVKVLGRDAIFADPWLQENHFFAPVQDSEYGRMTIVAGYADWGCLPANERAWSHAIGEDTKAILEEAGVPPQSISRRHFTT